MTAFASLILLIIIAIGSMAVVAFSNYKVEQAKRTRHQLQKYRARTEELEDLVLSLDQVCDTRSICKLVNDDIIELYETMLELDGSAQHLQAGLSNAKIRSDELSNELAPRQISRLCNSDAQIARLRAYLSEAMNIIRLQHTQGKLSTTELQNFNLELEWLHLQVFVVSNIVQGHKAFTKQDIMTANAFYKKAQGELLKSGHPDERRHQMIKQVSDILFGKRRALDEELMPESEFNPENSSGVLNDDQQDALEKILANANPEDIGDITSAMMQQHGASPAA